MSTAVVARFRNTVAAVAAAAAFLVTAPAVAAPSVQLTLGATEVTLSSEFVGALGSLGVKPDNVLPGALYAGSKGVRVAFPIPTGELDAAGPKLEILHSGGLTLTAGSTRVALTSFVIENINAEGKLQLTGVVKANNDIVGRIPLFDIELTSAPQVSQPNAGRFPGISFSNLSIRGAKVTLAEPAAGALNAVFGVSAFTKGFPIGVAAVSARVSDLDK